MAAKGKRPPSPSRKQDAGTARPQRSHDLLTGINRILHETLVCETVEQVAEVCLAVAEELTGSRFGFVGRINRAGLFDTDAISNPGWADCAIPEGEARLVVNNMAIEGLDRNTMREGVSRIVNDPANHPESKGVPAGHPPIECFLGVPLKRGDEVVGMIALANRPGGYTDAEREDVEELSAAFVTALTRKETEALVARQSHELLELSTPILTLWPGVVAAPLIGTLDSQRTAQFMERLLEAIVGQGARVVIVDITGVPAVDTQTAQHLTEATQAVRLLGARLVLTGIRPAIAQTLVHLGVDLSEVVTRASLSEGVKVALGLVGLAVGRREETIGKGRTR